MKKIVHFLLLFLSMTDVIAQNSVDITIDIENRTNWHRTMPLDADMYLSILDQTDYYIDSIDRHQATRVVNLQDILARSEDEKHLFTMLDGLEDLFRKLEAKNDLVIYNIAKMPSWLSSSSSLTLTGNGDWNISQASYPTQLNLWTEVVDSIMRFMVKHLDVNKIAVEIWDEPDYHTWMATSGEFYQLYKATFTTIRDVDSRIKIGTPSMRHWAGNFNNENMRGYIESSVADESILFNLIDSLHTWNLMPDFIPIKYYEYGYPSYKASQAINQMLQNTLTQKPPLYVTSWNVPPDDRLSSLGLSNFLVSKLDLYKNEEFRLDIVDKWQDLNISSAQFLKETGLITRDGLYKLPYYSALLCSMMPNSRCPSTNTAPGKEKYLVTAYQDTLYILLTNYCPDPLTAALNATMSDYDISLEMLDTEGIIDLSNDYYDRLDSIYEGDLSLSGSTAAESAVISHIGTYGYYKDRRSKGARKYNIHIPKSGHSISSVLYRVDSSRYDHVWLYDSLRAGGYSKSQTIDSIKSIQTLEPDFYPLFDSTFAINVFPNEVVLLKMNIPELLLNTKVAEDYQLKLYPNPTSDKVYIECKEILQRYILYDVSGKIVQKGEIVDSHIEVERLETGAYLLQAFSKSGQVYSSSLVIK